MRHRCLILFFLTGLVALNGCNHSTNEFSEAVTKFKDNFGNTTSFYFYNSTLKMVNFAQDASFDNLVKDIKKVRVITFKSDKVDLSREKMTILVANLHKESYVDMMQVSKDGFNILVFAQKRHEKPVKFLGLGYDLKSFYIIDLVGNIPISRLPSIISGDFNISGFNSVLNFTGPNNFKKEHKHKKDNGDDPGNQ